MITLYIMSYKMSIAKVYMYVYNLIFKSYKISLISIIAIEPGEYSSCF